MGERAKVSQFRRKHLSLGAIDKVFKKFWNYSLGLPSHFFF